jgi:hypothetical protein
VRGDWSNVYYLRTIHVRFMWVPRIFGIIMSRSRSVPTHVRCPIQAIGPIMIESFSAKTFWVARFRAIINTVMCGVLASVHTVCVFDHYLLSPTREPKLVSLCSLQGIIETPHPAHSDSWCVRYLKDGRSHLFLGFFLGVSGCCPEKTLYIA